MSTLGATWPVGALPNRYTIGGYGGAAQCHTDHTERSLPSRRVVVSARSVLVTLTAVSAVLAGCSPGGHTSAHAAPKGSSTSRPGGGAVTPPSNSQSPATADPHATTPAEGSTPCMSLIAEVAADRSGIEHVDNWKAAPAALTALAAHLGPTVTYDFTFPGPVTTTKSFADRPGVYAIVLDKDSPVDGDAVQATIEGFHLGRRVIILRSCTTHAALEQIRRQISTEADSLRVTSMSTGISTARAQVDISVYPPRVAKVIRNMYGDRVHVDVWFICGEVNCSPSRRARWSR